MSYERSPRLVASTTIGTRTWARGSSMGGLLGGRLGRLRRRGRRLGGLAVGRAGRHLYQARNRLALANRGLHAGARLAPRQRLAHETAGLRPLAGRLPDLRLDLDRIDLDLLRLRDLVQHEQPGQLAARVGL